MIDKICSFNGYKLELLHKNAAIYHAINDRRQSAASRPEASIRRMA